jgi:hypothetical protein
VVASSTVKHVSNDLRFLADYFNLGNAERAADYIANQRETAAQVSALFKLSI